MERDRATQEGIDKLVNGDRWQDRLSNVETYGLHEAIKAAMVAEMERQDRPFSSESYKNLGAFCARMARKIVEHEAFDELWRRIHERAAVVIANKVWQGEQINAAKTEALGDEIAKYEDLVYKWSRSDDVTRRFIACRTQIEELLPIPDDRYNTDSYTKQQAIRSRGLVMAALFGMRQIGSQVQNTDDAKEVPDGA